MTLSFLVMLDRLASSPQGLAYPQSSSTGIPSLCHQGQHVWASYGEALEASVFLTAIFPAPTEADLRL